MNHRRVGSMKLAVLAALVSIATVTYTRATAAQLIALKDGPVVMGHVGLNSTSTAEHRKFWSTLGGTSVSPYNREMFQFPNIYVSPGHGTNPTGGTSGTTVDHIAFQIADLRTVLSRMAASGYPRWDHAENADPRSKGAFLMGPDGIKVELVENTKMPFAIAMDHIHFAGPDGNAMREWYAKVLDARRTTRGPMPAAELPGVALIFQTARDPVVGTAGRVLDHVTFEVRGLAAFCERLQAAGIKLDRPYTRQTTMNLGVAFLTDPWGTSIELTEGYDRIAP